MNYYLKQGDGQKYIYTPFEKWLVGWRGQLTTIALFLDYAYVVAAQRLHVVGCIKLFLDQMTTIHMDR